ncbi:glycoside hydrolase [Limosilactobacillus reuteri]|uniref:Glycoside hydrolase n=1 Tax=Limosilactobacillus reuteri TaxID=1598 RepID=A0A855XLU0_LIMRT|nr:LysM peptidoglycan-binding domain-containing protein [Limosilactobacillus reuteri]PWT34047.1 glycoside hydrolase [Limosilactobacillus reuteri]PWT39192.1 glycoside hydrolase [Limosilactobacillus reuteri]PWT45479.1 glycoside hydrolase [Limosilactobacillus reuteri]PWT68417.1 glycoside hydrolase [Limosilactobacillus reuteri]
MFNKFLKKLVVLAGVITVFAPIFGNATTAYAAKGDRGIDQSVYQGAYGKQGYGDEKFVINQIGGTTTGWNLYDQWTYPTQTSTAIARGQRAHTYIWWQNVTTTQQADRVLDYFLPKIQTPKASNGNPGSIVALDVESGGQNTQVILYACEKIERAGFTAVVYGYKNYLQNNTNLKAISDRYPLWMAQYPDYSVRRYPNYNYFPSWDNIGMFQFTSTYIAGGLDGNVDLTGITDNGYTNGNAQKPKTDTPATEQGKQIHKDTHNYTVKSGDSWWAIANRYGMEMNALAQLNGKTINDVIHPGQVIRVADKGEGQSVSSKVNTTPAQPKPAQPANNAQYYTVRWGDSFWSIANKYGMNMYTLAANNGLSINSVIHPGQRLKVSGNAQTTQKVHYVRWGETLSGIAAQMNTSVSHLQVVNGIKNANYIWVGQRIAA